jgi:Protein of unknown function (DUF3800)
MSEIINIYCDESCHLENDGQPVMVLGALSCPRDSVRVISLAIRDIKRKHKIADNFEIKWAKVSPAQIDFYLELLDYIFEAECLDFRGLVVPNKESLRHTAFRQSHDVWYYKMYYFLLLHILQPKGNYCVFLDIKDTQGERKVRNLENYLKKGARGLASLRIQQAHSHELTLMQLADLLIGALSYLHRQLSGSPAKLALIDRIKQKSGLTLNWSTAPGRKKYDLFIWEATKGDIGE